MKKSIFLLICVLFSCKTSHQRALLHENSPLSKTRISIHRGGGFEALWPENALESFRHYLEIFPDAMLECDIRMTSDSVLVLMHDDNLTRTSTGTGLISLLPYDDIKGHHLKDNFGNETQYVIPRLDSVLVWANGKVSLTLDVKRHVPYEKVLAEMDKYDSYGNCIVTTYSMDEVKRLSEISSEVLVSCGLKNRQEYETVRNFGLEDSRILAFLGVELASRDFVDFLRKRKIPMIQATIGKLDKLALEKGQGLYKDIFESGIQIIATDSPFEVNKALDIINSERRKLD